MPSQEAQQLIGMLLPDETELTEIIRFILRQRMARVGLPNIKRQAIAALEARIDDGDDEGWDEIKERIVKREAGAFVADLIDELGAWIG